MANETEEVIEEYFEEIITYNNGLFGINESADLDEVNYIYKFERIFSFIDLIQKIDETFYCEIIDIMLLDIIKLLQQRSRSVNNSHKLELSYIQFTQKQDIPIEANDTYKEFIQVLKKYKPLLDKLLNTKFYYLDKYICHQILESKKIQYFLGTKDLINMKSIMEYIYQDTSKSFMKLDYNFFGIDAVYSYTKEQMIRIKSSALKPSKKEQNKGIEQLIKYKSRIHFFDNLDDEDIRDLVTDVSFKHYKPKETVIREKDNSIDIFFLVSGECSIMLRGEEMGIIKPQSIFGEFAFITKEKRSATVKTTIDSVIISFNFDLYSFEHNPCIYSKLYNNISNILVKKLTDNNIVKGFD